MDNPFLQEWTTKYGAIPFDKIKFEHFMPAIELGLQKARENVKLLKENTQKPDFENTILALSKVGEALDKPLTVYFNLHSAESNDEFKSLAQKISPMMSQFKSELNTDPIIFARVKAVYDNMANENLNNEQKRLLEKSYKGFVRNGALLDDEKKKLLIDIDQQMSVLSPQFTKNSLGATNAFQYHTTDEKEIEGLPVNDIKAAEFRAKQKSFDTGWLFNLQAPSITPVFNYAKNRELREKIYRAFNTRSLDGEFDNRDIILKEVALRHQRANLLGYKTHAHYILEERMAETPETVTEFLDKIYNKAMPIAKKEIEAVAKLAKSLDGLDELMPWDSAYYSEKLKKEMFGFDTDELRPYFKSENCVNGLFMVAEKLFGLKFVQNNDIPVYHKDVLLYEVFDADGQYLGLFYVDLYPRETKRGGAWMTSFQNQGLQRGKIERPHVAIVGNLTPSTETTPSLLSLTEVTTLFHEFGHALHGLLSDCTYTELSGASVYWDFVELPSQIMENWVLEEETLALFAHHYQTNETMPKDLIKKVRASQNFNKGMMNIRQLTFGALDMSWHAKDPSNIKDVLKYEEETIQKFRLVPKVENVSISTSFSHIFAGGYSAGYYSYKWAEVRRICKV
jgi:Zn-dependent oligopeptidase